MAVFVLGLPGRIAIARKHPDAEAINMMGWFGFMAVMPWMQAFMWAFKPTNVVDIRYFPKQEQLEHSTKMLARIDGADGCREEAGAEGTEASRPEDQASRSSELTSYDHSRFLITFHIHPFCLAGFL